MAQSRNLVPTKKFTTKSLFLKFQTSHLPSLGSSADIFFFHFWLQYYTQSSNFCKSAQYDIPKFLFVGSKVASLKHSKFESLKYSDFGGKFEIGTKSNTFWDLDTFTSWTCKHPNGGKIWQNLVIFSVNDKLSDYSELHALFKKFLNYLKMFDNFHLRC